jgi:hypothetical protein
MTFDERSNGGKKNNLGVTIPSFSPPSSKE